MDSHRSLNVVTSYALQFADFDTSGDGSIAASELIALMNSMGIETTIDEACASFLYVQSQILVSSSTCCDATQVQELIDKVDDNHSGELEYPEFVRVSSWCCS